MDPVRRIILRAVLTMVFAVLLISSYIIPEVPAASQKPSKAHAKDANAPAIPAEAAPEPAPGLFKEATFLLPVGNRVSAHWVLPPTEINRMSAMMSVDPTGSPLIGSEYISRIYLTDPVKEYMVAVDAKISGFVHLANGVLLLSAGNDIGFLAEPKKNMFDEKGVPIAGFQPLTALPVKEISVLSSLGNAVYCAGFNPQTGRYALYLLHVVKGSGLKDLEMIYESHEPITAVTGSEEATFVAKGSKVVRVARKDGSVMPFYTHPSATVRDLVMTPAGLVASTGSELVLAGGNGAIEIMRSSGHRIVMQGDMLYVLFKTSMGVLAIDNLADLKRFNLALRPVASGESAAPLSIAGVRFFESGPPPYTNQDFTETFDQKNVRRIVAQIDYQSKSASKDIRQHTITVSWYEPTGSQLMSVTYPVVMKRGTSTGQMFASIGGEPDRKYTPPHHLNPKGGLSYRFGDDALGLRYPGQYHILVQVDGIPAGEWSFNITGQARPVDVFIYNDISMLKTMLEDGLPPGQKNDNGIPLLNLAVQFGSAQAVELLLKKGANPNDTDKEGRPPLSQCLNGPDWRAKAELLVRYGANVNAAASSDGTPLVHSSSFRSDFTAFLIENGADIHSKNTYKKTLVEEIGQNNRIMCTEDIIALLLKHGADLNAAAKEWPWYSFLGQAISRANLDCVALLLNKGGSPAVVQREPNRPERSALFVALDTLQGNSNNNFGKSYPESITEGRQIVRLLLSKGAVLKEGKKRLNLPRDPNCSAFDSSCYRREMDNQVILLQGEGRIMFRGESPSFFDTSDMVRTLEQDDAALEEASRSDDPAIQELALQSHVGRVRELTAMARDKYDLSDAHDHCQKAFKLAEARYQPLQIDIVPDINSSGQGTQSKPFLGAALLKRAEGGAYVQSLVPNGSAVHAGLKPGDIILALDTQMMKDADEIVSTVLRLTPGMPVRVTFLRDDPMLMPELPLTCGLLEKGREEKGLAEMHLTRWLAANPDTAIAREISALIPELSGRTR